jgi:hypothetical protein
LFVEYFIFTFVTPDELQVILCTVDASQFSPPLGDVTMTPAGADIVNALLLISFVDALAASLIRTLACVVGVFGTDQE